jgi:hypothetical protein
MIDIDVYQADTPSDPPHVKAFRRSLGAYGGVKGVALMSPNKPNKKAVKTPRELQLERLLAVVERMESDSCSRIFSLPFLRL